MRTLATPIANGLLDTYEAAKYLNRSPNTLNQWRSYDVGPRYYQMGREVRYSKEQLDTYLKSRQS
ncbi:MAG: helix-turn-helix domain-containing protein [Thiolinea sp.]